MQTDMKTIEEMTLREIKELKEKYRDEFREFVNEFLKERPMIECIYLYRSFSSSIILDTNLDIIKNVRLKGEVI